MESLVATVAQSDKEAKRRIREPSSPTRPPK
jgi:hypothetical protein